MPKHKELYPPILPYNKGILDTDDYHRVYFEECGNPDGLPVLFFHGGPGAGCDAKDRSYFNPKKWRIVLFDQRGCGRSRPLGKLEENTTWYLIQDAKLLLDELKITRVVLFGGSWGSTMALTFAIAYPEIVSGMVLRGIFLGETSEIDYSEKGLIAQHFPVAWERFASVLAPADRKDPMSAYHREIVAKRTKPARKRKLTYEWTRYGDTHLHLKPAEPDEIDKKLAESKPRNIKASATLELHYFVNDCFFKRGFVLHNVSRIPDIPISIVHGLYDVICAPRSAYQLGKALTTSGHTHVRTFFTFAGHSKSEPETQRRLLIEMDAMHEKLKPR